MKSSSSWRGGKLGRGGEKSSLSERVCTRDGAVGRGRTSPEDVFYNFASKYQRIKYVNCLMTGKIYQRPIEGPHLHYLIVKSRL